MTVSNTQHLLIRITMAQPAEYKGMFYPSDEMWDPQTKRCVRISGAGCARAIKALVNNGLAVAIPEVHPYGFQLKPETMAAFKAGQIVE